MHKSLTSALAAAGTAGLMALGLGPASAHVHATPDSTAAGSSSLVTFDLSHGCSGSATTKLTVTLPDELTDAAPTANPNWEVEKVTEELAEPRTLANGSTITKRTSQIVYTAKAPLADGIRDTFTLSVKLPDSEGETLYFPVLQTCAEGSSDWSQIPSGEQSAEDLDYPAPALTLTAASPSDAGHGTAEEHHDDDDADDASEETEVVAYVGLGAGLLGLAAGVLALFRTRRPANR